MTDRESEEAGDALLWWSYSGRSLALPKRLRVDEIEPFGEIRYKGILSEGLIGVLFPHLKIPKVSRPISVNYRIMSSYRSYPISSG